MPGSKFEILVLAYHNIIVIESGNIQAIIFVSVLQEPWKSFFIWRVVCSVLYCQSENCLQYQIFDFMHILSLSLIIHYFNISLYNNNIFLTWFLQIILLCYITQNIKELNMQIGSLPTFLIVIYEIIRKYCWRRYLQTFILLL